MNVPPAVQSRLGLGHGAGAGHAFEPVSMPVEACLQVTPMLASGVKCMPKPGQSFRYIFLPNLVVFTQQLSCCWLPSKLGVHVEHGLEALPVMLSRCGN